jgi:hypothetical protein
LHLRATVQVARQLSQECAGHYRSKYAEFGKRDSYVRLGCKASFVSCRFQLLKPCSSVRLNPTVNTSQKPLFGTSLEESANETGRQLSLVLECCIHELMQHLDEEGIFRVPGPSSKLKKLRTLFNLNAGAKKPPSELLTQLQHDPHSVAGCLKSYLRELPEPLLGYAMYQPLLAAARLSDPSQRLTSLWQLIQQLPPVHLTNLRFLIKFLAKLATHSEQNKMNPQNIAIAIAPSLIWSPADRESSAPAGLDMCAANQYGIIIDALVTHADWFFPGGTI